MSANGLGTEIDETMQVMVTLNVSVADTPLDAVPTTSTWYVPPSEPVVVWTLITFEVGSCESHDGIELCP